MSSTGIPRTVVSSMRHCVAARLRTAHIQVACHMAALTAVPVILTAVTMLTSPAALAARPDEVTPAAAVAKDGVVSLSIDYSSFREAFGGDWESRLQLVRVPDCLLVEPVPR